MRNSAPLIAMGAAGLGLIILVLSIKIGVWNECRGQGNSFFYCWSLVSR